MSDTDLNFKISTSAELSALRETERELVKAVTAAKALGKGDDVAKFGAQLSGVQARLAQFSTSQKLTSEFSELANKIPGVGTALNALEGTLGPVALGLGAAATALATAKEAVNAYAAAETDVNKLNQALANSGQYSAEASAAVQELANKWKDLTDIDDSKFISVSRTLLQFGAKTGDLDKYTEAVVNLAGIMGGDIDTAATLFGKALQGSTEMLGRYGIKVDASASQTQQLDSIMQQAAARGAGQLTAGSETLNRKFAGLRLGTDDLLKGFGNLIARTGVVQFGLDALRGGVILLNKLLPDTIKPSEDYANKLGQIGLNAEEAAKQLEAAKKAGEGLADVDLAKLDTQAKEADAAFARLTATIRATEQAKIALTDAKLARDLAQIDDDEKSGKFGPSGASAAAQARFDRKQQAEDEKTALQLASIEAQKKEQQDKVANAAADVARRQNQVNALTGQGAKAGDTAEGTRSAIEEGRITHQTDQERRKNELAALNDEYQRVIRSNRYGPGGPAQSSALQPILKKIDERQVEGGTSDESFSVEQARLTAKLSTATAEAARIKAELEKLKPELEKAKAAAEETRKDANATTAQLDVQAQSVRATAPIKKETAQIANRQVDRDATAKDRMEQEDEIDAALHDAKLENVRNAAQGFLPNIRSLGSAAIKSGDKGMQTAAKRALDAATATNDGATEDEAKEVVAAFEALQKTIEERNQKNARLEKIVSGLAAQVKTLASQQSNRSGK